MNKHKVTINVTGPDKHSEAVIRSEEKRVRSRLLKWLLGGERKLLLITPGDSVSTVEITELTKGGKPNE
ncbi:hypothetical protein [Salisediminibacterium selenitireducens]|uniref:Uncharacterized protein n=1 Tax=Bacillus selenitireducens (strain ATCC 700615 / DSM 15326 / MLS10) TaxID=439292 RepID=D6XYY8_BACIE|nr:hypothetical protein [Salisediminibacterium selenitireducens]ADH98296.1 hypothetical protein Bsel_0767 [[Bacillus] selenitireducens MLS10]